MANPLGAIALSLDVWTEYEQNLAAWKAQIEDEKRQKVEARKAKQNQDLMPKKRVSRILRRVCTS